MSRWVIAPIIGDGTQKVDAQLGWQGPYRSKASDYGSHVALIPTDTNGAPAFNWSLSKIADSAVTAAEADPDLTVFPDLPLDHVLTLAQRNWLITRLQNHGLPFGWVVPGITVIEVLRTIGRWLENQFDIHYLAMTG